MTQRQFETELLWFINNKLIKDNNKITKKSKLFKNQIIDSLKILDLIAFIEKKLNTRIEDNEIVMDNFETVEAMTNKFFSDNRIYG